MRNLQSIMVGVMELINELVFDRNNAAIEYHDTVEVAERIVSEIRSAFGLPEIAIGLLWQWRGRLPEHASGIFDTEENCIELSMQDILKETKIASEDINGMYNPTYSLEAFVAYFSALLAHELQHAVQFKRGEEMGEVPLTEEEYYNHPLEVEAGEASLRALAALGYEFE